MRAGHGEGHHRTVTTRGEGGLTTPGRGRFPLHWTAVVLFSMELPRSAVHAEHTQCAGVCSLHRLPSGTK